MHPAHSLYRLKQSLAAALCLSLAFPPATSMAQTTPQPQATPRSPASATPARGRSRYKSDQLQGDERILHALNRFTFGPRPGDLQSVKATGLERWFDQQLHPAALDQSDLTARLAQYPAMQRSPEDLLFRLPSNGVIRQSMNGKGPIPANSTLHAIYEDQIYRVAEKKQEKQDKQAANSSAKPGSTIAMNPESAASAASGTQPHESIADGGQPSKPDQPPQSMSMTAGAASPDQPPIDPALIPAVLHLPPEVRVARLASMKPADADAFFKTVKGPQRADLVAGLSPELKEEVGALENPQRTVVDELLAQRLTRDIYSSAQLQEVMTDFWLNHFNVFLHKNEATPYYLVSYERDVIRPRALGKFEDLLEATAHSPAMMIYLDNAESIGPDSTVAEKARLAAARQNGNNRKAPQGLNENYARELMELHTLGVNGGYTQADVTQVARILTGWTVDRPQRGGGFKFDPTRHQPGTKKALGKKFREDGEKEGRDLLHMLAMRPSTAHFLSRKLAVRFVSDDPPASLVNRMAKTYLSSHGDIAAVLKTMYHSSEFWSTNIYRAKVKTPIEYVVSAARASNADIANMQPLANALRDMGMPLYGAVPPTGYKWDAADWVSTGELVNRMNFALSLAANRLPGITTTWAPATGYESAVPTPVTEEPRLEALLVEGEVSDSTRSAVLQQFQLQTANAQSNQPQNHAQPMQIFAGVRAANRANPAPLEKQDQLLAGLLLGSPEFQRR